MNKRAVFLLARLAFPVLLFLAFLAVCVTGYGRLERLDWIDALFWTLHPHAIDYQRVGDATKLFSLAVFIGLFAFQIWFAERILLTFFSHRGQEAWRGIMNDIKLEIIEGHVIVCGYGQVGHTLIKGLERERIPFIVLETNESLYQQALKEGLMAIHGDAKRHTVLEAAGIKRARSLCAVIDSDADNLYITITAKAMNPRLNIITRAGHDRYAQAMISAGASEVVIPEAEGGKLIARLVAERLSAPDAA